MKAQIVINPTAIVGMLAIAAVGFVAWRTARNLSESVRSMGDTVRDSVDWITGLPSRAVDSAMEYAQEGGTAFLESQTPNPENRVTTPGSYTPVYQDPLTNDDGMNWRYF